MLVAYIDEVGESGAFISRDHPKFKTSPAFGYAGFLIPENEIRSIGAEFTNTKRRLFPNLTEANDKEIKGASIFRPSSIARYPHLVRVFTSLMNSIVQRGGKLFYYVDEKPIGTPKQTSLNQEERKTNTLSECLNRLATEASRENQNLVIIIDQINEKQRRERTSQMYRHIIKRSSYRKEMDRIVEPPCMSTVN